MTWSETHRYYDALLAVVAELDRAGDGRLPWRPEYAQVFGDRHGLVLALRRRWELMVQAQGDGQGDQPGAAMRDLVARNRGMLSVLAATERGDAA